MQHVLFFRKQPLLMTSPQRPLRQSHAAFCALTCAALLLAGCGEDLPDDGSEPADSTSTAFVPTEVQTLTQRFLEYSYRGAMLSSTHPLNDSLQALTSYSGLGSEVMLVDTFSVDSIRAHGDSMFVAEVRFPQALTVSSEWQTSNPAVNVQRTLRIQALKVASAPRIVGWTALQDHIRNVRPENAQETVQRLRKRFEQLKEEPEV